MAQTDKRTSHSHTANGDGSMAHTDKRASHTANGDGVTEPHVKESTVQHVMNWTGTNGTVEENPSYQRVLKGSHKYSFQEDRTSNILVLYCGGTIGMKNKNGVYVPEPNFLVEELRKIPTFHDSEYVIELPEQFEGYEPLVLPLYNLCAFTTVNVPRPTNDGQRIIYSVWEYEPLLDSSNMTYNDYIRLAIDIQNNYTKYDGFVILHGTDTMSFTASALSFMLENLGKPVVLTGSQIPIFELRSDGRSNFINALIVAGTILIPEVTILFNQTLYRGNRTSKVDNGAFDAFNSPNMEPLVKIEIDIKVNWEAVYRHRGLKKFEVQDSMCADVGVLRLFPSITESTVRSFLQPPMQGVVLQTYGQGNGPDSRTDLMEVLKEACDRGVIIVNTTQCARGIVSPAYAVGKALMDVGVISGYDMTVEAAVMKLSYLLAKEDLSVDDRRRMMGMSIRGELSEIMTENRHRPKTRITLLENLAETMRISSREEMKLLHDEMFPYLICSAASEGSIEALDKLRRAGARFNMTDYDGRTPLHIACSSGNVEVVRYLLDYGGPVHVRDHFCFSPLDNALQFKQIEVVKLLTQTGAHISKMTPKFVYALINVVVNEDISILQMWVDAGADLNVGGFDGRTPLHFAVHKENIEKCEFLMEHGADARKQDNCGRSPLDDAKEKKLTEIIDILKKVKSTKEKEKV